MSRIAAKIKDGIVVNVQIIDKSDKLDPDFDWKDITESDPSPGIGWKYKDGSFSLPDSDIGG